MKRRLSVVLAVWVGLGCGLPIEGAPPPLELSPVDRLPPAACTAHWVAGIRGRVRLPTGGAAENVDVQLCVAVEGDTRACLPPSQTDARGWYAVAVPEYARCMEHAVLRATLSGGPERYATSFMDLDLAPRDAVLEVSEALALNRITAAMELPPLGNADEPRVVRFVGGAELELTPSTLEFRDSYEYLAGASVPLTDAPAFAAMEPAVDALFAFGPELAVRPGVPFRLPASDSIPDGAVVDLFLVGGVWTQLNDGRMVEEGSFEAFGTGTVRDGWVEPHSGSELPYLTWLGYRVRR